jgi:hypothetical protein
MTQDLEQRHDTIWHHEQVLAFELAKQLIPKPKISLWMMMLPLLFIFFMQDIKKYKTGIRKFSDDFLRNKKNALDLAYNAAQEGTALDAALAAFAADHPAPSPDQSALYEAQRREIVCLSAHYMRLLTARGDTYEKLVRNGYGSFTEFQRFMDTLFERENDVIQSALHLNPPEGDSHRIIEEMQRALRRLRQGERDRIF